jgi:biopolymer transport protein ExbD
MVVAWGFAEGGSGIIGVGPDGLKKWGEKRGGRLIAADAKAPHGSVIKVMDAASQVGLVQIAFAIRPPASQP